MAVNIRTVWKFPLRSLENVVALPKGAQLLHVGPDARSKDAYYGALWAEIPETDAETVDRTFLVFGTGQAMPMVHLVHVGSFISEGGRFVWHVYERRS